MEITRQLQRADPNKIWIVDTNLACYAEDMDRQVRVHVSGYVQGVGFRQFVKHHARKHGATGWVRNSPDGRVEIVLQGRNTIIESLLSLYRQGPMLAEVEEVIIKEEPITALHHDFVITHE